MALVTATATIGIDDPITGHPIGYGQCVTIDNSVAAYAALISQGVLVPGACLSSYSAPVTPVAASVSSPAYVIVPDGSGGAVANANDAGLTTLSGADPADVFQNAINALAVQNGGKGGEIAFKGQMVWDKQVILYPGIAISGQGPLGNKNVQNTGATIQSTFNGDTLLVRAIGAGNRYFPYLENFTFWGDNSKALQNLVRFDNSGGDIVFDCFLRGVSIFNAGLNGVYVDSSANLLKLWLNDCYLEGCTNDGLQQNGGTVRVESTYINGAGAYGIRVVNTNADGSITNGGCFIYNCPFWNNNVGLRVFAGSQVAIVGNSFEHNGTNASGSPQAFVSGTSLTVVGNTFKDSRGASAVLYNLRVAVDAAIGQATIVGNTLSGAQTQNIQANYQATSKFTVVGNSGHNDLFGKVASPFQGSHISFETGGSAAPSASTDYRCVGSPLNCVFAGGTGVSITIKDAAGNTVQSGLTSFAGLLPVGYVINFGAFSVAPTVYVGVA